MLAKRFMMQTLPVVLLGLLITDGSAMAGNHPPIVIHDADYGGSGCPEGTASVIVAGDTLTILFDQYAAETSPGRRTDYKSCNFAVALGIPAGFTVALVRIDYRGFADIPGPPHAGLGWLRAEYFWSGSAGPIRTHYFGAGHFGNWMETDTVGGLVWSPCGDTEVIARANTSVVARKSSPYSAYEAMVQVDSADIQAGIVYHFMVDHC